MNIYKADKLLHLILQTPNYLLVIYLLVLLLPSCTYAQGPVLLDESSITNLNGYYNSACLVDAQNELPLSPPGIGDTIAVGCGMDIPYANTFDYFPMWVLVDLGISREVTTICLYDFEGFRDTNGDGLDDPDPGAIIELEYLDAAGDWQSTGSINLLYNQEGWRKKILLSPFSSRFLRFKIPSADANIGEVAVYSTDNTAVPFTPPCTGPSISKATIPFDQLLGINFNFAESVEYLQAFGHVREYHYWNRVDSAHIVTDLDDLIYQYNPYESIPGWSMDSIYQNILDYGLKIVQCNNGGTWYTSIADNRDMPPIWPIGSTAEDPESYLAIGDYLFQSAARYGNRKFKPSEEFLIKSADKKTGLGVIDYLENWNESNKWWNDGNFSPEMYAAMSSVTEDGHELKIASTLTGYDSVPATVGIKNADPGLKSVFAGTAGLSLEYVKAAKRWFELNRDDCKFPYDAISFHNYAGTRAEFDRAFETAEDHGLSPESWGLRDRLEDIVRWRNLNAPGVELWLTEFGYDTNPYSPIRIPMPDDPSLMTEPQIVCDTGWYKCAGVPSVCSNPVVEYYDYNLAEEIHGQWMTRSFLEIAASGFDRGHAYTLEDLCTEDGCCVCYTGGTCPWGFSPGAVKYKYKSSGMVKKVYSPTGKVLRQEPKKVWWYVYTMKNIMAETVFAEDLSPSVFGTAADVNSCPVNNADAPNYIRNYRFEKIGTPSESVYAVWTPTSCQYTFTDVSINVDPGLDSVTMIIMTPGETDGVHTKLPVVSGEVIIPEVSELPVLILAGSASNDIQGCNCAIPLDSISGDGNTRVLINNQEDLNFCAPAFRRGRAIWRASEYPATATIYFPPTDINAIHILDEGKKGNLKITIEHLDGITEWTYLTEWSNIFKPFMGLNYKGVTKLTLTMMDENAQIGEIAICGTATKPDEYVSLTGHVGHWCDNSGVPQTSLSLYNTEGLLATAETNSAGNFNFIARSGTIYSIQASKSELPLCGIDPTDYIIANKHLNSINSFGSVFQLIAADVNNDNNFNIIDLNGINNLGLGTISSFQPFGGKDWKFTPADAVVPAFSPFSTSYSTLEQTLTINPITAASGLDFKAIKSADINCSCAGSIPRIASPIKLVLIKPNPTQGETWIDIESTQDLNATIELRDMMGKLVFSNVKNIQTGLNTIALDGLQNVSAGILSWTVRAGEEIWTGKLVKQ